MCFDHVRQCGTEIRAEARRLEAEVAAAAPAPALDALPMRCEAVSLQTFVPDIAALATLFGAAAAEAPMAQLRQPVAAAPHVVL